MHAKQDMITCTTCRVIRTHVDPAASVSCTKKNVAGQMVEKPDDCNSQNFTDKEIMPRCTAAVRMPKIAGVKAYT